MIGLLGFMKLYWNTAYLNEFTCGFNWSPNDLGVLNNKIQACSRCPNEIGKSTQLSRGQWSWNVGETLNKISKGMQIWIFPGSYMFNLL